MSIDFGHAPVNAWRNSQMARGLSAVITTSTSTHIDAEYRHTQRAQPQSKSFIKVSLLYYKDHPEFELRETHTKIFKIWSQIAQLRCADVDFGRHGRRRMTTSARCRRLHNSAIILFRSQAPLRSSCEPVTFFLIG